MYATSTGSVSCLKMRATSASRLLPSTGMLHLRIKDLWFTDERIGVHLTSAMNGASVSESTHLLFAEMSIKIDSRSVPRSFQRMAYISMAGGLLGAWNEK